MIAFLQSSSPVSSRELCYLGLLAGVPRAVLNAELVQRSLIVVFLAKTYPIVAISTTLFVHLRWFFVLLSSRATIYRETVWHLCFFFSCRLVCGGPRLRDDSKLETISTTNFLHPEPEFANLLATPITPCPEYPRAFAVRLAHLKPRRDTLRIDTLDRSIYNEFPRHNPQKASPRHSPSRKFADWYILKLRAGKSRITVVQRPVLTMGPEPLCNRDEPRLLRRPFDLQPSWLHNCSGSVCTERDGFQPIDSPATGIQPVGQPQPWV